MSIKLSFGATWAAAGRPFSVKRMRGMSAPARPFAGGGEGLPDRFRLQRQFVKAHSDGVVNGIGDRRRDGVGAALADPLCPERAVPFDRRDGFDLDPPRQVAESG